MSITITNNGRKQRRLEKVSAWRGLLGSIGGLEALRESMVMFPGTEICFSLLVFIEFFIKNYLINFIRSSIDKSTARSRSIRAQVALTTLKKEISRRGWPLWPIFDSLRTTLALAPHPRATLSTRAPTRFTRRNTRWPIEVAILRLPNKQNNQRNASERSESYLTPTSSILSSSPT